MNEPAPFKIELTIDEALTLAAMLTLDLDAVGFSSRQQHRLRSVLKKLRAAQAENRP